ncbi:Cytochrome c oxidase subunit 4, variant 2 [Entomophthora muscae]|uniref:Cytochrome c oxidase subunit 4, variant 2 n=1 Tax=Entomophthora muscae TaxID=34485 RepID=A0ACC2SXK4_9FUNG|nr:Cytochrome c oxidase subunit 4, variant 2 [Entomophthora muscae]
MLARFGINALKSNFSKRVLNVAQPARLISYSAISRGGHHGHDPIIVGPGGKAGEVPTDLEQAAGHARLELLADMEGREFFDLTPPTMTHHGTKKNPVFVESTDPLRYVACTGIKICFFF